MWAILAPLLCILTSLPAKALSSRQEDEGRLLGNNVGYLRPGALSGARAPDNEVDHLFETAGRQPDDTSSVSFEFAPDNLSSSPTDTTWTWVLNTTELAVPEDVLPGDLRVVNQQWALHRPGGGNLQSALNKWGIEGNRARELCFGAAIWQLPPNITSRYADAEPGDCSAVLGAQCADSIRAQSLRGTDGRCGALSGRFDECTDTIIGPDAGGSLGSSSGFDRANSSDTFYYKTSPALPAGDELEGYIAAAETSLHVLLVKDVPTLASDTESRLLCQVVSPEASGGVSLRLSGYMIGLLVMVMMW